jgi:hypothetical protein
MALAGPSIGFVQEFNQLPSGLEIGSRHVATHEWMAETIHSSLVV